MSTNAVVQRQAARSCHRTALLLLAACLAPFASHAAPKGTWSDGVARDQSFARVLVVGISPDLNTRCPFERAMAAKLRSPSTMAFVSCDVMPLGAELTREGVEAAVAAQNADAVLTTSLVSQSWEVEQGGTNETRGSALYKATDAYYGVYGTVVAGDFQVAAPLTTIQGKAHVISKLYETRGATVVYTLDTEVRDIETRDEGIAAVTAPIGKKLRKDGLIR